MRTTNPQLHRRRALLLFGLLVAVATLAASAACDAARASAPSGFVGTVLPFASRCGLLDHGDGCLSDQDLDRMQEAHVRIVRWGFRWSRVQPLRLLPPDWRVTDAVIGSLANRGISVLPVLTAPPSWAAKTHRTPPLDSPAARDGWRRFVTAAVDRYGLGGEFWKSRYGRLFPGGPIRPITSWQVWNEQNLGKTFPPRPSPHRYSKLVRITDDAVETQDPNARVVLGGMPGYVHPRAWVYLDHLYRQPGIKGRFDAVALHPYAPDVRHVKLQIERVRRVMRAHHDAHSPLWITELGWGSESADWFGINVGGQGQKRMLKRAFSGLVARRHRWRLAHVFWFDWRDPRRGWVAAASANPLACSHTPRNRSRPGTPSSESPNPLARRQRS